MKKAFKVLAVLFTAVTLLALTGCKDLADKVADKLKGPEKEWEQYDYSYQVESGTVDLNCFVMFSTTDTEVSTGIAADAPKKTIKAGLTVLVVPKASTDEALVKSLFGTNNTGNKYVIKNFPLNSDADLSDGEDPESSSFKVTQTKWTLIYNGINWSAENRNETANTIFSSYTEMSDVSNNFSWKKILKNFLINGLLGD